MSFRGPYKSQTQPRGVLSYVRMPVIWSLAVSAAAAEFINLNICSHDAHCSDPKRLLPYTSDPLSLKDKGPEAKCRCVSCAPTNIELETASKCKVEEALKEKRQIT